jgi:hypothetical protein
VERFADHEITPRFWELIEAARGEEGSMRSILDALSREDLIRFGVEFDSAVLDLVYHAVGDRGDMYDERDIAGWVVSRGLASYAFVWDHPEQFPAELPTESDSFYGLDGVVFEERFPGQPMTTEEPYRISYWPKARSSAAPGSA